MIKSSEEAAPIFRLLEYWEYFTHLGLEELIGFR